MYLSELAIIVDFIDKNSCGAIVKNIYRSLNGTIIKLFGAKFDAIYFNLPKKVLFPLSDDSIFPKDEITNLEESFRKYLKNQRINSVCLIENCGKTIRINFPVFSLIIPLFANSFPYIEDKNGEILWASKNREKIKPLTKEMLFFEPKIVNPLDWSSFFLNELKNSQFLEKKKRLEERILFLKKRVTELELHKNKNLEIAKNLREKGLILQQVIYTLDAKEKISELRISDKSGEILLLLDSALTVSENLNNFFEKAKKHERKTAKSAEFLAETEKEIVSLERELLELSSEDIVLKEEKSEKVKEIKLVSKKDEHKCCHVFTSKKGAVFLVGKSAEDNDELTFKVSSPHDIWFHIVDMGGSHVILKKEKNKIPTEEEIFLGCALALFYSKAKKGMQGEVWFTERKNIYKKKGMPPGKVLITKAKSKYIKTDESFLEKLEKKQVN